MPRFIRSGAFIWWGVGVLGVFLAIMGHVYPNNWLWRPASPALMTFVKLFLVVFLVVGFIVFSALRILISRNVARDVARTDPIVEEDHV